MIRSLDHLIHCTPAAQVHETQSFGHQLATTFAADVIQSRIDQISGRISTPVVLCFFTHAGSGDRLVVVRIDFGTGTDGTPVVLGCCIQRSVLFIAGFHIVQISFHTTEGDRAGVAGTVGALVLIIRVTLAQRITGSICLFQRRLQDGRVRLYQYGMCPFGRLEQDILLSRFFQEDIQTGVAADTDVGNRFIAFVSGRGIDRHTVAHQETVYHTTGHSYSIVTVLCSDNHTMGLS